MPARRAFPWPSGHGAAPGPTKFPIPEAFRRVSRRPSAHRAALPEFGRGLSLAFEFVGAVLAFWFLGRLVDNWLGIAPSAQIVGSLLGWAGGFLHVYYHWQPAADSARRAAGLPPARRPQKKRAATGVEGYESSKAPGTSGRRES